MWWQAAGAGATFGGQKSLSPFSRLKPEKGKSTHEVKNRSARGEEMKKRTWGSNECLLSLDFVVVVAAGSDIITEMDWRLWQKVATKGSTGEIEVWIDTQPCRDEKWVFITDRSNHWNRCLIDQLAEIRERQWKRVMLGKKDMRATLWCERCWRQTVTEQSFTCLPARGESRPGRERVTNRFSLSLMPTHHRRRRR